MRRREGIDRAQAGSHRQGHSQETLPTSARADAITPDQLWHAGAVLRDVHGSAFVSRLSERMRKQPSINLHHVGN